MRSSSIEKSFRFVMQILQMLLVTDGIHSVELSYGCKFFAPLRGRKIADSKFKLARGRFIVAVREMALR